VWSQARLAGHPFGQPERQSTLEAGRPRASANT
jgi:hypothetical protein